MSKRNKEDLKTIVYIVGCGHSGSTLLSMVVGGAKEAFSAGELKFLSDYLSKENPDPYLPGNPCTCGVSDIRACETWKAVLKRFSETGEVNPEEYISRASRKEAILHLLGNSPQSVILLEEVLLDSIFEVSKAQFIIDASKSLTRLARLLRTRYRIMAIHLVRDVRGFSQSMSRLGVETRSSYGSWLKYNILVFVVRMLSIGNSRVSWTRVSYDCFAQAPERETERICEFLGVQYRADMTNYCNNLCHNIGGNPMRTRKEGITYRAPVTSREGRTWILRILLSPFNRVLTGNW